jgi:isopenicillin N synthase-like dioxygenase
MAEKLLVSEPDDLAASATIPVVDLASFLDANDGYDAKDGGGAAVKNATRLAAAKQLVNSCRHVGFVYIVNHGVPTELIDEAFGWARRLFALPLADKMKAPHPDGFAVHRGYSHPGLEKVSQALLADDGDPADADVHEQLRQVRDCKVRPHSPLTPLTRAILTWLQSPKSARKEDETFC